MTDQELIALFNPDNAANLTEENLKVMRALTDQQIDVLAKAYPNQPQRNTYLMLYDTSVAAEKQVFQPSTWQNLRNVRKFGNRRTLIPWNFRSRAQSRGARVSALSATATRTPRQVVDMSAEEAAAELKRNLAQQPSQEAIPPVTETPVSNIPRGAGGRFVKADDTTLPADMQFHDGES